MKDCIYRLNGGVMLYVKDCNEHDLHNVSINGNTRSLRHYWTSKEILQFVKSRQGVKVCIQ